MQSFVCFSVIIFHLFKLNGTANVFFFKFFLSQSLNENGSFKSNIFAIRQWNLCLFLLDYCCHVVYISCRKRANKKQNIILVHLFYTDSTPSSIQIDDFLLLLNCFESLLISFYYDDWSSSHVFSLLFIPLLPTSSLRTAGEMRYDAWRVHSALHFDFFSPIFSFHFPLISDSLASNATQYVDNNIQHTREKKKQDC